MADATNHREQDRPLELQRALEKLEAEIRDGLRHGFFEYTITGEVIQGGKRRVLIKAGKSHLFIIPEEEVKTAG